MRIHRVHTDQAMEPGGNLTISGSRAHYLNRVLRVVPGQAIVLFNGDGHDYVADIVRPGRNELILAVNSRLPAASESGLKITVVQALSRGERMDQTLQKCTELGVTAFQPLISERVEVRLKEDKLSRRIRHWQGVVISACEQSGRAVIPIVREPLQLSAWLAPATPCSRLVLEPGADKPLAGEEHTDPLELVVGPEGGFTASEMDSMCSKGVRAVSLGPRVLRTETAAPAAVAVLQALSGDFC